MLIQHSKALLLLLLTGWLLAGCNSIGGVASFIGSQGTLESDTLESGTLESSALESSALNPGASVEGSSEQARVAILDRGTVDRGTVDRGTVSADSANPLPIKPESPVLLLIKDQKFAAAEKLLKQDIKRQPRQVAARTNLALLYAETQRKDEAQVILLDIVQGHPNACPAQLKLGQLHREAFRFDKAEAAYQACLSHEPKNAAALRNLGILHELYRGAFDSALTYYERYQSAVAEPDQQVQRWIADLSRRLESLNQIAEAQR